MKKISLIAVLSLFIFFPLLVKAQYSNEIVAGTVHQSFLVGSLPPDNSNNYAKLQIDILGGDWGSNNLGVTTFYVGNRGGLVINQTTNGSGTGNYTIKAYANPNLNIDIYIVVNADYPSFAIKSCMLEGNATQLQTIVQQTPAVGETDVTPTVVPVLITDQAGNIGINTGPYPDYKFAVNGAAIATSFTVKAYPTWSDYVFYKDYHLLPLSTIKAYVDLNHHLPEIPSAAEMAKNGINLGKMDELLMKKVEELTLYLIDKDEKEKEERQQFKTQQEQLIQAITKLQSQDEQLQLATAQLKQQQQQIKELSKMVTGLTASENNLSGK